MKLHALMSVLMVPALLVGLSMPASAAALAKACESKPSALSKPRCACIEHELQKVLTPQEMRIQILAFRGKYNTFRQKLHSMNASEAKSFMNRVNGVLHGTVCNH